MEEYYYYKLYANKFANLEDMEKNSYTYTRLTETEPQVENLKRLKTSKKMNH